MKVKRRLKGFRRRLRGRCAQNGLFYKLVQAIFAADFLFGQCGFEQGVVLRQGIAFGFVVPEVVGDTGEFEIVARMFGINCLSLTVANSSAKSSVSLRE